MSPYKPTHEVRCAHCAAPRAELDCRGCRRPVCDRCRALPSGCDAALAYRIRIGFGRRTLAIEPTARLVVAAGLGGRGMPTVLELEPGGSERPLGGLRRWDAFRRRLLSKFDPDGSVCATPRSGRQFHRATLCPCGRHVTRLHSDETISISLVDGPSGQQRETVRGQFVFDARYDCQRRQLVIATHNALHVFSCDESHRVVRRQATLKEVGRPLALDCADGYVASLSHAVVQGDNKLSLYFETQLRVFQLHDEGIAKMPVLEWQGGDKPQCRTRVASDATETDVRRSLASTGPAHVPKKPLLALGRAGRVALALDQKRVLLADAGAGDISVYRGHRFEVTFVGFAGDRLVSGDDAGRLIIRDWDGRQHAEL